MCASLFNEEWGKEGDWCNWLKVLLEVKQFQLLRRRRFDSSLCLSSILLRTNDCNLIFRRGYVSFFLEFTWHEIIIRIINKIVKTILLLIITPLHLYSFLFLFENINKVRGLRNTWRNNETMMKPWLHAMLQILWPWSRGVCASARADFIHNLIENVKNVYTGGPLLISPASVQNRKRTLFCAWTGASSQVNTTFSWR